MWPHTHLRVDARGPLESELEPCFPPRMFNCGEIRFPLEVVLSSRRKAFEGTRSSWTSWLLWLAILKVPVSSRAMTDSI